MAKKHDPYSEQLKMTMGIRAGEEFREKLEAVTTWDGAWAVVESGPRKDQPGRGYYSNLGFFLNSFDPPNGAGVYELTQYLRILRCLNEQGAIKGGVFPEKERKLESAIAAKV